MVDVKPGLYKHFKGGSVIVLGVAKHSEAHHMELVVYRELGAPEFQLWARPRDMFVQRIQRDGYDGPRFWRAGTMEEAMKELGVGNELIEDGDAPVEAPRVPEEPEQPEPSYDASIRPR